MGSMKERVIAVYRIVERGDSFTVSGIQRELLNRYDISADRKTIYDDLAVIDRFIPIRMKWAGRKSKYERWEPAK